MPDSTMSCSLECSAACYALDNEFDPRLDSAAAPAAQAQPSAAPPADLAARLLVSSLKTSEQVVHAPPVGVPVIETAEHCASKLGAVAIALLSNGSPVIRALGALKSGLDISECAVSELNAAQTAADRRAAVDQCVAHSGTPLGFVDNTLTCAVPAGKAP
ncbi:MAG TPA: hypothetical protein VGI10_23290 [Polyangiaceae bacterium]|jgi:hypothetical protein